MLEAQLISVDGNKVVGSIELPENIFAREIRVDILHEAVRNHRANKRQGTASTKTRSEVRGGGKKPWRQKGTGRARAGTNTSPIWRKGGVAFGPQPRSYSYKLNKKFKKLAVKTAFSAKISHGNVIVVESLTLETPKTKEMANILKALEISGMSVLILTDKKDEFLERASRNIPKLCLRRVDDVSAYDILAHEKLLLLKDSVERLKEVHAK